VDAERQCRKTSEERLLQVKVRIYKLKWTPNAYRPLSNRLSPLYSSNRFLHKFTLSLPLQACLAQNKEEGRLAEQEVAQIREMQSNVSNNG
jgi:hypothetical protein